MGIEERREANLSAYNERQAVKAQVTPLNEVKGTKIYDMYGALDEAKQDIAQARVEAAKLKKKQEEQNERLEALRQQHLRIDRERRAIAKVKEPDKPVPPPVPVYGRGGEELAPLPVEPVPVVPVPVVPVIGSIVKEGIRSNEH